MDNQIGGKARDAECDGRRQPSLLLMPGKMTEVVSRMFSLLVQKKKIILIECVFAMVMVRNQRKTTLTLRM